MKRLFSLLAAMLLVLSCACASAEQTFSTPYYSLTLPSDWETDTEDLETDEDFEDLGFFWAPDRIGLVFYACHVYFEDMQDVSLWNMDEAGLQDYAEDVLYMLEDDSPELLGFVKAGSIPFVLVRGEDEDGEYLYADTMSNGHALVFEIYVLDEEGEKQYPVTDKHIEQVKSILETFVPGT